MENRRLQGVRAAEEAAGEPWRDLLPDLPDCRRLRPAQDRPPHGDDRQGVLPCHTQYDTGLQDADPRLQRRQDPAACGLLPPRGEGQKRHVRHENQRLEEETQSRTQGERPRQRSDCRVRPKWRWCAASPATGTRPTIC